MPRHDSSRTSLRLDRLGFVWPDGRRIFDELTATLTGTVGLVGPNGTGKSVLLKLAASRLAPTEGSLRAPAGVAYLPQETTLRTNDTVADLLGVSSQLSALRGVLGGDLDGGALTRALEAVGDEWDLEERSVALLAEYGLPVDGPGFLTRRVGTLSGGEAMIVALAGVERAGAALTLCDEPTNNLDSVARGRFYTAVERWNAGREDRTLMVASHDVELLRRVDTIAELRPVGVRSMLADRADLRTFSASGTDDAWEVYQQGLAAEREGAERRVREAESSLATERRQRIEADIKLARSARSGRAAADSMPKILANARRNQAEATAGRTRTMRAGREGAARADLDAAREELPADTAISIDLPDTLVPAGRTVLDVPLDDVPLPRGATVEQSPVAGARLHLRGPERVRVTGRNGAGKSTLLAYVAGTAVVPVGWLRQRLGAGEGWEGLRDDASVLDNVRAVLPGSTDAEIRAKLARFHFRGGRVDEPAGQLSGGERFRVALARILLADPAPQLMLLDEPTNNLDLDSVDQLVSALEGYGGALLLVTHDEEFARRITPECEWHVG
ncbi:ATP-binding cassette domain-containing protein [Zhihengliuella salsuginis]|uniref:ABC transporter n=1 Tax=Zhihengliuella salsuginis TaxID=578222 RepID=A0ABQ3GGT5_9MICC|nr:ATP-binding cassette domain-containing protein [Zhihengliuella salsuginis]GHD03156.1 ABC transporter [Zhihengliuella salsuginis]